MDVVIGAAEPLEVNPNPTLSLHHQGAHDTMSKQIIVDIQDGKTEITFLRTGVHCTMQCRVPRE